VDLVPVGTQRDHMARLTTAFSGGRPPDLFLLNYRRFGQLAERGVLEPLGPRAEAAGAVRLVDFYPQALEAFRQQGSVVCLPQNVSSLVVYYNRRLFQEAGLAAPHAGWTWDDMLAAARALTRDADRDGRPEVHGLGLEPTFARLAPFVWQAGGEVVDNVQRPHALTLHTEAAKTGLRYALTLRRLHGVTPSLQEVRSEDLETRFARGQLGMLLHSRRLTASLREVKGLDWDVAPLPVHPQRKQPVSLLHADAYCMAKASKVKDAALRFVQFALSKEGAAQLAKSGRTVPSRRSVAESAAFLDASRPPASASVFLDAIPHLRRLPNVGVWNEVETRVDEVVEEWYYAPPPEGGTRLGEATAGAPPGGSAKRLLNLADEVSVLSMEANEAVTGLLGFGRAEQP
jgi:multiple sugar transport system substrate-binding protein